LQTYDQLLDYERIKNEQAEKDKAELKQHLEKYKHNNSQEREKEGEKL
jgi:hypothetical protein